MADYQIICSGASTAPSAGAFDTDCTTAGGTVTVEEVAAGFIPDLTLAEGGAIGAAMIALWAVAWAVVAIRRVLGGS